MHVQLADVYRKLDCNDELNETLGRLVQLGGSPGCSNTGNGFGSVMSVAGAGTGDESPSNAANKKSVGLFKKLKEKRAKKRSIVGQENHVGEDGIWRTGSPIGEERKSIINRKYIPKVTADSKNESVDSSATKSPDSLNSSGRVRSWSHGNINKISHVDSFEAGGTQKVTHSSSTTFSSGTGTQNSQEDSVPSDKYVVNGPSSGDHQSTRVVGKYEAMYATFGDEVHKETLKDLQEFLDSSGETKPMDLSILQDWNGWVIGTTDVV